MRAEFFRQHARTIREMFFLRTLSHPDFTVGNGISPFLTAAAVRGLEPPVGN